jgi:hypothetical protein
VLRGRFTKTREHQDKKSLNQRRYQDDESELEGRYLESKPRKRSR